MELGQPNITTSRITPQLPPETLRPTRNSADAIDFEMWQDSQRTRSAYLDIEDDSFLSEVPAEVLEC